MPPASSCMTALSRGEPEPAPPGGTAAGVAKHKLAPTFSGEQSNRQLLAGASRRKGL